MSSTIETMLFELGRDLEYPRPPDVRQAVRARLAQPPAVVSRWRGLPALGAAAAVALGAVVVLVAPVREAVADLFGIGGIDITVVDELPAVSPRATDLRLGEVIALDDVNDLVEFDVQAPSLLGAPDEFWFDDAPAGGAIHLVYHPGPDLPESGATGLGALLTQYTATIDPGFAHKLVDAGDSSVRIAEIAGSKAFFISGGGHIISLIDADGVPRSGAARLAGNTLIWEQNGQTFRLEAEVGLQRALEIARSLTEI